MKLQNEKPGWKKILMHTFLLIFTLVSLYPLIWMMFYSLKNNNEIFVTNPFGPPLNFRIENYKKAITQFEFLRYFSNSLIVTFFSMIITITFSLMFSYSIARLRWKMSDLFKNILLVGIFIPIQIILIPLLVLIKDMNLMNTHLSLIIPYAALKLSFASLVFYGFLRTIPFEMEESACIDGANIYTSFIRIIVPLVKPAIAMMIIFLFFENWNEFTLALILISKNALKTLPLGLMSFQGQFKTDWGAVGAVLTISSIPTIATYLMFSEKVEGAFSSVLKG